MEKKEYTSPYDFEGKIPLKLVPQALNVQNEWGRTSRRKDRFYSFSVPFQRNGPFFLIGRLPVEHKHLADYLNRLRRQYYRKLGAGFPGGTGGILQNVGFYNFSCRKCLVELFC